MGCSGFDATSGVGADGVWSVPAQAALRSTDPYFPPIARLRRRRSFVIEQLKRSHPLRSRGLSIRRGVCFPFGP
jgi:hypothetical protein